MEENQKMTIFYYKDKGDIFSVSSQVADFSCYKRLGEAYKLVMDYAVVDYDLYVIMNPKMFMIDENKKLKLYGDLSKYQ